MRQSDPNKIKYVKRKYVTKSGEVKYYTYEYQASGYKKGVKKEVKTRNIVTSTGRIVKSRLDEYVKANANVLTSKAGVIKDEATIRQKAKILAMSGKAVDAERLTFLLTTDKITLMITNAGFTPQQVADSLGVPVEALLDQSNWTFAEVRNKKGEGKQDAYFSYEGKKWKFNSDFKYDDIVENQFVEVTNVTNQTA